MELIVAVGTSWNTDQVRILLPYSDKIEAGKFSYAYFSPPVFEKLRDDLQLNEDTVIIARGTEFSKLDVTRASYGYLQRLSAKGYPQPEDGFGYLQNSFDLSEYCSQCGTGAVQMNSLRIDKEIKWNRPGIGVLEWLFDAILIEKTIFETVLKPLGIKADSVFIHKTNKQSETTVQLNLPITNSPVKDIDQLVTSTCSSCGRKKYTAQQIGYFSGYSIIPNDLIFQTQEYFGHGGMAYKRTVVSQQLLRLFLNEKLITIKNIVPVDSVPSLKK